MSNSFAKLLYDRASERFSIDAANMSVSDWICKNTTLKKEPFSFKGYEFQRQIVDDMHPDLNVIKISQVGLTEIQIRKALAFLIRNRGTHLIFSLPTEDMFTRVSKARVKPIVNADKVFNSSEDTINKATRSADTMQFGQSFLYLVPAIESAATSISADFVMNDEVDLSDQKIISLFNSRLQGSKYRLSQKFSTPTFPSFGIDQNWKISDQHLYMVRCKCCGHWNHPEFNHKFIHISGMPDVKHLHDISSIYQDEMDLVNAYVKCEKCHKPLDLNDPSLREWVAQYPSRNVRGYRITPFVNGNLGVDYILKQLWMYQKNEFIRGWYNTVLGMPYSDGNIQIPVEDIEACMLGRSSIPNDLSMYGDLWVGIDVGQICHVVIGAGADPEKIDIVSMYQVKIGELLAHVKELCEKYPVRGGCIDRHPYTPTSEDVFRVTNGLIVPTEYRGNKDVNIVMDETGEDIHHAQVYLTSFLDNCATRIRKRTCGISGYGHQKQVVIEHYRDMVREETPGEPAKWTKLHGNDHYFHASAFMFIAPQIKDVIRVKSKAEFRTLALTSVVPVKQLGSNIIGISPKRVDSPTLTRQ